MCSISSLRQPIHHFCSDLDLQRKQVFTAKGNHRRVKTLVIVPLWRRNEV